MTDEKTLDAVKATAETESRSLATKAAAIEIACDDDLRTASGVLGLIAGHKKELEAQRQFFVRPLNEQVKKINDLFRSLSDPFDRAGAILQQKILGYRKRQEELAAKERIRVMAEQERARKAELERIAKAQARLDKKAEKAGVEAPQLAIPEELPLPAVIVPEAPKTVAGVTARKVWTYEVTDSRAVPREYLKVDEVTIGAAVRSGAREIPGVRIFEKEVLAVRA